jgi:hypothetical protein
VVDPCAVHAAAARAMLSLVFAVDLITKALRT